MEILFLILKIIGILLAVFILLVGAVLAVPVRYRVNAGIQQQKAEASAVLFWVFHIIDCRIHYSEDGLTYKLRIFGILFNREKKKRRKPKVSDKSVSKKSEVSDKEEQENPKISGKEEQENPEASDKKESENPEVSGKEEQENPEISGREEQENPGISGKAKQRKPGKRRPFWRIRRFGGNLKQQISDKITGAVTVKEKIQNIKKMILDETNKSTFVQIWRELRFLIRHYSPRKASGELAFGMEDPSQTGQILGALSVLPFWARYKISINPDFQAESFFVEGRLQMKGHIRLWHFLLSVIRLIKDKKVRQLLEKIRT